MLYHMLRLKRRLIASISEQAGTAIAFSFNGPKGENSTEGLDTFLDLVLVTELNPWNKLRQLPNTVSVSFTNLKMRRTMPYLFEKVACSAGSACHADHAASETLSPVLAAMKVNISLFTSK